VRVFTAVTLWVLAVELLLGLGFVLGYYWLGGWQMGLLVAGVVLLLLVLPWLGELQGEYDSRSGQLCARVGWWGRVRYHRGPPALIELRLCGIPWRRRLDRAGDAKRAAAPAAPQAEPAPRRRTWQLPPERAGDLGRALWAALGAGHDLLWDARRVYVQIDAPTQHQTPDQILARVFGHRGLDPLELKLTADEQRRRVQVRYRVGLFRAAVTALCAACQARVWALRDLRRGAGAPAPQDQDDERRLIVDLQEQLSRREQDKESERTCPSST